MALQENQDGVSRRDVVRAAPAIPIAAGWLRAAVAIALTQAGTTIWAVFQARVEAQEPPKNAAETGPKTPGTGSGKLEKKEEFRKVGFEELKYRPVAAWDIPVELKDEKGKTVVSFTLHIERGPGNEGVEITFEGEKKHLPKVRYPTLESPKDKEHAMSTVVDEALKDLFPDEGTEGIEFMRKNGRIVTGEPKVKTQKEGVVEEKNTVEYDILYVRVFSGKPRKVKDASGKETEEPTTIVRTWNGNEVTVPAEWNGNPDDLKTLREFYLRGMLIFVKHADTQEAVEDAIGGGERMGRFCVVVGPEQFYEKKK